MLYPARAEGLVNMYIHRDKSFLKAEMNHFSGISLQVTKNGYFMILFKTKGSAMIKINNCNFPQTSGLHGKKVILCVWWDHRSIIQSLKSQSNSQSRPIFSKAAM